MIEQVYVGREEIIRAYIDYFDTKKALPNKKHLIYFASLTEKNFDRYFSSISELQQDFWVGTINKTIERLNSEAVYQEYTARERMLAFYYTWLEVLSTNRAFVIYLINNPIKTFALTTQLKKFKTRFISYITDIQHAGQQSGELVSRPIVDVVLQQVLWAKLLFILGFWVKDTSFACETTDAAVEKTVHLAFDLLSRNALDSAFDLTRFLISNKSIFWKK